MSAHQRVADRDDALRFRIDLGYDGTDFHGWARQPGERTVEGAFHEAVNLVIGPDAHVRLVVAGRTDAGVHARAQVAHLDIAGQHRLLPYGRDVDVLAKVLTRKLRGALARHPDIAIHSVVPAEPGFDARFSATGREYAYRIADNLAIVDPIRRRDTLRVNVALDERQMDLMARAQVGFHDWAAFCKPRPGATTLRTLTEFSWRREDDGVLVASIAADAFCHNMVRYLVGASVAVGRGRISAADVDVIRESREHALAVVVVPPHGLTMMGVTYPSSPAELSAQAERSRARRVAGLGVDDDE